MTHRKRTLLAARAALSLTLGLALLASTAAAVAGPRLTPSTDQTTAEAPKTRPQDLDTVFTSYELLELDLPALAKDAESTRRIVLDLGGRRQELRLEPVDLLSQDYRATITTDDGVVEDTTRRVTTYRGSVEGKPDSEVRLLVQDDLLLGYVRTPTDWLFIDPASKYIQGLRDDHVVVYREEDVRPEYRGTCGVKAAEQLAGELANEAALVGANDKLASPRVVEIATDADFEFFQLKGSSTNAFILGILNQADGIYTRELNLSFRVTFQSVFTTAQDPYTTADSKALLGQFRSVWNSTRGAVRRDLAYLFTGRDLAGSVVGRAFTGVVCNDPGSAYGICENRSTATLVKIVTHEIGHNFNARHDDTSICPGSGPIMCPSVQSSGANVFSQASKNRIVSHVNSNGSCISAAFGHAEFYTTDGAGGISLLTEYSNWRETWDIIISAEFNGDDRGDLLFFDREMDTGEFYATNGAGGISQMALHTDWGIWPGGRWDIIIPGSFGGDGHTDLLFYDRETGTGEFYATNGAGGIVHLQTHTNWGVSPSGTWDMIIPGSFGGDGHTDLLFYDRETGLGEFYTTNGAGGIIHLRTHTNWGVSPSGTWDMIIPGSFGGDGHTDLLFYDRETGTGEFYATNGAGGIIRLQTHTNWGVSPSGTWDMIIPGSFGGDGHTDLLFYDRETGLGEFYTTNGAGGIIHLQTHTNWGFSPKGSWDMIIPGSFGGNGFTDLLFYQR